MPAMASPIRAGSTSNVTNRQSIPAASIARSKRYWAGLPAAGQPKTATISCNAGLVIDFPRASRHRAGHRMRRLPTRPKPWMAVAT
jgi:hypothetical protein